ncbi:MAG: UDP-3-O-(3-hydroxymyristoyl)glucosamine N-acyltransferase [Desulfobacteraceae bacterium]|nr:UDP-3-O-(3-hydroxymyristoyl)glucosamine N-acyltransferase [Desulfobacteraceae bacterium]
MPATLAQLAQMVGGQLAGDAGILIEDAAPIDHAERIHITFAEKGPSLKRIPQTKAGAILVPIGHHEEDRNLIQVKNPRLAYAKILEYFHPQRLPAPGIHPSAVVGDGCTLGSNVSIGAGAVIGDRVTLAEGVVLYPLVVLGDDVSIGDHTVIYPHVTILEHCRVGRRCIIHAGTVIGSDGFGFVQDGGRHHKIPQIGIVQIDDDVEIGANNTIDRAGYGTTWVQSGVKTDDLVHLGHNVVVGEHTLLVAQVGIAGSTTVGHHAILAGQAGIAGHIAIGNEAVVGPKTGVAHSVPDKQIVSGAVPAMPHRTWLRFTQVLPELPDLQKKVRQMEARLAQLEEQYSLKKE